MDKTSTDAQTFAFNVCGIKKKFGTYQALADVSFSVIPGEILGLFGPNGSGKSTLLECITGLEAADSGTINWQGKQCPPDKRKQILWYQPDNILPYARQKVRTTLTFFRDIHGAAKAELERLVNRLELISVLDKALQNLSKGYRRRVLLALALLSRRPLLMLDEPFDGFDLRQSLSVMKLLHYLTHLPPLRLHDSCWARNYVISWSLPPSGSCSSLSRSCSSTVLFRLWICSAGPAEQHCLFRNWPTA